MSKQKEKRTIQWKAILISLGITCVLLGIVIGVFLWVQSYLSRTGAIVWEGSMTELVIGNGVAFIIMFLIIYHFVKKPKEKNEQQSW